MTTEHDKWLAAHATVVCRRLRARISQEACAAYRAANQSETINLLSGKTMTRPGLCAGCDQAVGALPVLSEADQARRLKERKQIKIGRAPVANKGGKDMGTKKECNECHRVMSIRSHGLCAKCFDVAKKAEKLPPMNPRGAAVVAARQKPKKPLALLAPRAGHLEAEPTPVKPAGYTLMQIGFAPEDQDILQALQQEARDCRRTVEAQILWLLDNHFDGTEAA